MPFFQEWVTELKQNKHHIDAKRVTRDLGDIGHHAIRSKRVPKLRSVLIRLKSSSQESESIVFDFWVFGFEKLLDDV